MLCMAPRGVMTQLVPESCAVLAREAYLTRQGWSSSTRSSQRDSALVRALCVTGVQKGRLIKFTVLDLPPARQQVTFCHPIHRVIHLDSMFIQCFKPSEDILSPVEECLCVPSLPCSNGTESVDLLVAAD